MCVNVHACVYVHVCIYVISCPEVYQCACVDVGVHPLILLLITTDWHQTQLPP